MRKIISMLLLLFMVAGFMPVYADPLDDGGNSGGGSGGGGVSGSTWREQQSGYRITVVDKNKRVVATVVDFVYSSPNTSYSYGKDGKYWYTNSRFTGLSSGKAASEYRIVPFKDLIDQKQIDSVPHYPIYSDKGKLNAGGEYFKEWFLAGAYGMDFTQVPQKPKETPSSPKNVETGTSRPVPGSANYSTGSGNGVPVNRST